MCITSSSRALFNLPLLFQAKEWRKTYWKSLHAAASLWWLISVLSRTACLDWCVCDRRMCCACLFAVPCRTEMFFVASFIHQLSFAFGTGVWLGSREATLLSCPCHLQNRLGESFNRRKAAEHVWLGRLLPVCTETEGFCEDQSRQKAKHWKCSRKSLSSEPRVIHCNLTMKQSLLYVFFFPISVLVPLLSQLPQSFTCYQKSRV